VQALPVFDSTHTEPAWATARRGRRRAARDSWNSSSSGASDLRLDALQIIARHLVKIDADTRITLTIKSFQLYNLGVNTARRHLAAYSVRRCGIIVKSIAFALLTYNATQ